MSGTESESERDDDEAEQRSSGERENEKNEEEDENDDHNSQEEELVPAARRNSSSTTTGRSFKTSSLSTLAFPISRVRRLVKSEVDAQNVGQEAGFLIAKAAELFLEKFVEDAFQKMTDDDRTTLSFKDLASHVSNSDRLDFLADFVPEPIPAFKALAATVDADN